MKSLFSGFTATNDVNLLFDIHTVTVSQSRISWFVVLFANCLCLLVWIFCFFASLSLIFFIFTFCLDFWFFNPQHRSPLMQLYQTVRFIQSKLRLCSTLNHSCDDWTFSHYVAQKTLAFFFTTVCSLACSSVFAWCWRPLLRRILMSTICTSLIDFSSVSEKKTLRQFFTVHFFALR